MPIDRAIASAQALVDRELSRFTGIEPHAVDVAAAAVVEGAERGTMEPRIRNSLGRAEAFSFSVGVALVRPEALVARFVLPQGILDHKVYESWCQPGTARRKHHVVFLLSVMRKEITTTSIEAAALADDRIWLRDAPLRPQPKR